MYKPHHISLSEMMSACKHYSRDQDLNRHTQPGDHCYHKERTNLELFTLYIYTFNHRDTEEEILCQVKIA
jgi:hypothetical protein